MDTILSWYLVVSLQSTCHVEGAPDTNDNLIQSNANVRAHKLYSCISSISVKSHMIGRFWSRWNRLITITSQLVEHNSRKLYKKHVIENCCWFHHWLKAVNFELLFPNSSNYFSQLRWKCKNQWHDMWNQIKHNLTNVWLMKLKINKL